MSRNYYSEINLHLVWHTKNSLPLLTPTVEPLAYHTLTKRIVDWPGAFVHAIGGIETHVHIVVTVPPTLLISDFLGQLKGGSSHDVNHRGLGNAKSLQWQAGYGVVSFGTGDLPWGESRTSAISANTMQTGRRRNAWSVSRQRSEKARERACRKFWRLPGPRHKCRG